jgi:hypothetical protein
MSSNSFAIGCEAVCRNLGYLGWNAFSSRIIASIFSSCRAGQTVSSDFYPPLFIMSLMQRAVETAR